MVPRRVQHGLDAETVSELTDRDSLIWIGVISSEGLSDQVACSFVSTERLVCLPEIVQDASQVML